MSDLLVKAVSHLATTLLNWVPLERHPREDHRSPSPRVSKHYCVYAHYDPDGRIDPYVLRQLEAFAAEKFAITLVSTAPSLVQDDVAQALKFANRVIRRSNLGHDFGSWKLGLSFVPVAEASTVILANDSVYGPFQEL